MAEVSGAVLLMVAIAVRQRHRCRVFAWRCNLVACRLAIDSLCMARALAVQPHLMQSQQGLEGSSAQHSAGSGTTGTAEALDLDRAGNFLA